MTYKPAMPVLFLTNQSELGGPTVYLRYARRTSTPAALWTVGRDGHCNVNDAEVLAALAAMVKCAEAGQPLEDRDGTIEMADRPSVAASRDGRLYAKVTEVSESYGNLYTQFVGADLATLGIKPRGRFMVAKGDKSFAVLLATTYGDVPRGEWVAFITADGTLEIARNFANAAETLGCKAGDEICIFPVEGR
jgi:S-adenosylmethionine hydrolase